MGCLARLARLLGWWHGRVVPAGAEAQPWRAALAGAACAASPGWRLPGFPVAVVRSVDEALAAVSAAGVPIRGRVAA